MIISQQIDLKHLQKKGKQFPWKKPRRCPKCGGSRLWGHGYVLAYFDPLTRSVYLKRYRCPDCRTVFRCRPSHYFSQFQASIQDIRDAIEYRQNHLKWNQRFSRNRQRHWYRGLLRHIAAYLTHRFDGGILKAFDLLMARGMIPVSRSI